MAVKQISGANAAPDGSQYVTLTDGAGNLISATGGAAGTIAVGGDTASGTTDAGNPVKIGGKYNASVGVTIADGQRGDIQINSAGVIVTGTRTAAADALSNSTIVSLPNITSGGAMSGGQPQMVAGYIFNGTTWDRVRTIQGVATTGLGAQATVYSPTSATQAGIANNATTVAGSSQVLKASAGNLYSVSCAAGASAGYLLVFNATSAPSDGTVTPIDAIPVAANAYVTKSYAIPVVCNTGITLVFSTTGPFTKTASATAFLAGQAV